MPPGLRAANAARFMLSRPSALRLCKLRKVSTASTFSTPRSKGLIVVRPESSSRATSSSGSSISIRSYGGVPKNSASATLDAPIETYSLPSSRNAGARILVYQPPPGISSTTVMVSSRPKKSSVSTGNRLASRSRSASVRASASIAARIDCTKGRSDSDSSCARTGSAINSATDSINLFIPYSPF